jgi:CheY-like chemotaxis protein
VARYSILVVDDDDGVRQVFRDCLRILGHEAQMVSYGEQALRRLARRSYDLLLTDLAMPCMSGLDVACAARRLRPSMPIIIASGSPSPQDLEQMGILGVVFLAKPVGLRALTAAIESAMASRSSPAPSAPDFGGETQPSPLAPL